LAEVEAWLRRLSSEELFDESGKLIEELREMARGYAARYRQSSRKWRPVAQAAANA